MTTARAVRDRVARLAALPVARQLLLYGVVGGAQLLLDYVVFVGLTALGLAVIPANLAGRVAGACLGYFLNRYLTFASVVDGERRERGRVLRFCIAWIGLTVVGTAVLEWLASGFDLKAAWIAKPVVDGLLAIAGFLLSRYWIYR